MVVSALVATTFIVTITYTFAVPPEREAFTEFYVLGAEGMTHCYPDVFQDGNYSTHDLRCDRHVQHVVVGINNHERHDATYQVRIIWTDENGTMLGNLMEWETPSLSATPADEPFSNGVGIPQYTRLVTLEPPPSKGLLLLRFELTEKDGDADYFAAPLHLRITNV